MAQHDYNIANQTAASLRADLNNVLSAIVSNNSGATEPADTFANMFWYDTTTNILKIRNEADDAWISLGYLDQTADAFRILDDTQVTNTSGTQTGLLGDQSTGSWQAGTGTTESLVSPAKIKAAIDSLGQKVTPTTVNTATATNSVSELGTYAFLGRSGATILPGSTYAGSNLSYASVGGDTGESNDNLGQLYGTPSGTWRCMGYLANTARNTGTLFLRIS
jgi:hypothetical protein